MAYPTPIEWTDAAWNPVGGCSIASPGCGPCYAQRLAGTRLRNHPLYHGTTTKVKGKHVFNGKLTAAPEGHPIWHWPRSWRGAAHPKLGDGEPSLIFVGDMSDLFHRKRARKIVHRALRAIFESPHIGQLLTKRPEVMEEVFVEGMRSDHAVRRFWLGTSAERQKEFDKRWPHLRGLARLGFTVFISYEPALGPLTLPPDFLTLGQRAWLIAGGTSGAEATPSHPDWFRRVRDQCVKAGVPFFFKQWGAYRALARAPHSGVVEASAADIYWPDGTVGPGHADRKGGLGHSYAREGNKSGRLLDGREWNEFPSVALAPAQGEAA